MQTFHGTDANTAIITFFGANMASLADHTRSKMVEALAKNDLLGTVITSMETLYAARADLNDEGLELLDGLARFVSGNNFYGKGIRAAQIAGVATRILAGGPAEAKEDPEVEDGFGEPEPLPSETGPLTLTSPLPSPPTPTPPPPREVGDG